MARYVMDPARNSLFSQKIHQFISPGFYPENIDKETDIPVPVIPQEGNIFHVFKRGIVLFCNLYFPPVHFFKFSQLDKADCRIDIAHMIPVALRNNVIEPAPFITVPAPRVLIYPENPLLLDLLKKGIIIEDYGSPFPARDIFDWIKTEAGNITK